MADPNSAPYERAGVHRKITIHSAKDGKVVRVKLYVLLEEVAGRPTGISLKADKEGSTIGGLLKALGETATLALSHGTPLEAIVSAWSRMSFEPSGATGDPAIQRVTSIPDAVARWLALRYQPRDNGG